MNWKKKKKGDSTRWTPDAVSDESGVGAATLELGVCMVRLARYFFKFVTEPIEIGFVIIKTDAYQLGLVFWPMAVQFDQLGLIGLVGLIWNINKKKFVHIKKICSHKNKFVQQIYSHK